MKRKLLFSPVFFLILALVPASADALQTRTTVASMIEPEKPGDTWIFLLSAEGRALRVLPEDQKHIAQLRSATQAPKFLQIEFTPYETYDLVEDITELGAISPSDLSRGLPIEPLVSDQSSNESPNRSGIVGRVDFKIEENHPLTPQGIFDYWRSFNLSFRSQCFHRAYYWAHQLWNQTGVATQKVFVFFTPKFVRRTGYGWWFHVSPYVFDKRGREVVLDATYLKKPVDMKTWTDHFIAGDPYCPVVSHYRGYQAQAGEFDCYVVKSPMVYYHPNDIEAANKAGTKIEAWDPGYLVLAKKSRWAEEPIPTPTPPARSTPPPTRASPAPERPERPDRPEATPAPAPAPAPVPPSSGGSGGGDSGADPSAPSGGEPG